MDFITGLPESQGYDSLFVVKCRLSKMTHFIPCTKDCSADDTGDLFLSNVFKLHGCPSSIVSDRGPQFVSKFWKRFFQLLDCKVNLSSTHHPQSDGSTEVLNL
eukprot:Awhi_evm1s2495